MKDLNGRRFEQCFSFTLLAINVSFLTNQYIPNATFFVVNHYILYLLFYQELHDVFANPPYYTLSVSIAPQPEKLQNYDLVNMAQ